MKLKSNGWHLIYIAIIAVLSFFLYKKIMELRDTESVLDACSERYYQEIGVLPKGK